MPLSCMFSMPAGSEWLIILVIVLIFFGAGRLPDVLKQMGKWVRAFKDASNGEDEDEEEEVKPRKAKKKAARQLPAEDDLDEEVVGEKTKNKEGAREGAGAVGVAAARDAGRRSLFSPYPFGPAFRCGAVVPRR